MSRLPHFFPVIILLFGVVLQPVQAQEESDRKEVLAKISRSAYGLALEQLEEMAKENPDRAETWYLIGLCRNRLGLFSDALDAVSTARQLGADTKNLNREQGFALQGMQKWRAALQALKQAPEKEGRVWLARGQVEVQLGNYEDSVKALNRAIELAPELEPRARYLRARVFALRGDLEASQKESEKGKTQSADEDLKNAYKKLNLRTKAIDQELRRMYRTIFTRQVVDESENVIKLKRRDDELKKQLQNAIKTYRSETGKESIDSAKFRSMVRDQEALSDVRKTLQLLTDLFRKIDSVDVGKRVIRNMKLKTLRRITPDQFSIETLVEMIDEGEPEKK